MRGSFFKQFPRRTIGFISVKLPEKGLYANWNNCIRLASGRYVYIAGNDDTIPNDFLEKQTAALEQHPECGLAHCRPRMIDENGCDASDWWPGSSLFARSSGGLLNRKHIHLAPFDGLLHLVGDSVYTSMSQILIRRSLFNQIGLFESRWGPVGDFNWGMRAGLVTNTIHVPDTWGGWRRHSDQATDGAALELPQHRQLIDEMIEHAVANCQTNLTPQVRYRLRSRWMPHMKDMRKFFATLRSLDNPLRRRIYIALRLLAGSWTARQHIKSRLAKVDGLPEFAPEEIRKWLKDAGIGPVVIPVADQSEAALSPQRRCQSLQGVENAEIA